MTNNNSYCEEKYLCKVFKIGGNMFEGLIKKTQLNVHSMLRHGSVAVVTLFVVGTLFGIKNVMMVFPIAMTSTVMGRQNFHVKTINKALKIAGVDLAIVLAAHISSLDLYLGIPINFISIFFIMYTIVSPYDLTFYKPFLMLYVFTQYAAVPTEQLSLRLLAVIIGIGIVIIASTIKKPNEKVTLENSITSGLKDIDLQLENILRGSYDKELQNKISKAMRDLAYKIYVTRYRGYLTTNLGKVQFRLFISLEYLNLCLLKVNEKFIKGEINISDVEELKTLTQVILDYNIKKYKVTDIKTKLASYIKKEINFSEITGEEYIEINNINLMKIFENIVTAVEELNNLEYKEINKVYNSWERTDLDKPGVMFKEYFDINTIRFKFALRMSLTMTVALFLGEKLGYYKIIWAIITIMSIMQPYYEETKLKAKERVIGNVLAILITGIVINIADSIWVTVGILVMSLYLLYGFKEYYKISMFAGMASMCIASLEQDINILIFYRVIYVILGVAAIMLINKYVIPYRINEGIDAIAKKIERLKGRLISAAKDVDKDKFMEHEIRDLVIHSTLLSQKLYIRNLQYNYPQVDEFIEKNNLIIIGVAYNTLRYAETKYKKNSQ